jgi:hypothetical protein
VNRSAFLDGSLVALLIGASSSCSPSEDMPPDGGPSALDDVRAGEEPSQPGDAEDPRRDAPADSIGEVDRPHRDTGADLEGPIANEDASPTLAPTLLSSTGLFTNVAMDGTMTLAPGVQPYEPKYALWSDGATKQRWVYLPPGATIDTSDPDHWSFPVGTKFWKEFVVDGRRIETRLLWRTGEGQDDFVFAAYLWEPRADGGLATDAVAVHAGMNDALGTTHDIPSTGGCTRCHIPLKEHVLGFGAIELAHDGPGLTLAVLNAGGSLSLKLSDDYPVPGNAVESAALGYLHANCGNCHNDSPGVSSVPTPVMDLRVPTGASSVEETGAYKTAVNQRTTRFKYNTDPKIAYRIAGGDPARSCISYRMSRRAEMNDHLDPRQMPPLATEVVDAHGLEAVAAFISLLPPPPDE